VNRQELVEEYKDYGYSNAEIAEMLDIDIFLVRDALVKPKRLNSEKRAKGIGGLYKNKSAKHFATDRERESFELLYKYGPLELNKMINRWGVTATAVFVHVRPVILRILKDYFASRHPLPGTALEMISYFSNDLRREVDNRDNRVCQRCNRPQDKKTIRYHKIAHPGLCTVDNCITLCTYCRNTRILPRYYEDRHMFDGMDYEAMHTWIQENDPFIQRNRVYPKGKIGTWKTK